ncbi:MAG: hypothetical protein JO007_04615 [Alphaproteobacteria bacterium]|nr:hypothetical protein [Alphaproteobacteria bacterium]
MRVPVFSIVASLALLAAPAFAQNGAMTGTTGDQNGMPGYTSSNANSGYTGATAGYNGADAGYAGNGAYNGAGGYNGGMAAGNNGMTGAYNNRGGGGSGWANGANVTSNTRERIRQSLLQSGFRDVSVTPEAFVIHAMAPDGSRVVMLLRPDELTGVVETGSSNGGGNGNYGNNGYNGGANANNGGDNTGGANR